MQRTHTLLSELESLQNQNYSITSKDLYKISISKSLRYSKYAEY